MNRTELQTRLQNFFNNSTYYTGQDFNDSIQDGLDEACAFSGCVFASAEIPFIAGKSYYDMLTLLPNYIGVYAIFNQVIRRWLIPSGLKQFNNVRIDWETALGTPYYFSPVNHRYVAIYMKPSAPTYGNMVVFYLASAPILTDSTIIPMPEDHITTLEQYCITDLWEQSQEFGKANANLQVYQKNLEQLRVYMRNKRNSDRLLSLR